MNLLNSILEILFPLRGTSNLHLHSIIRIHELRTQETKILKSRAENYKRSCVFFFSFLFFSFLLLCSKLDISYQFLFIFRYHFGIFQLTTSTSNFKIHKYVDIHSYMLYACYVFVYNVYYFPSIKCRFEITAAYTADTTLSSRLKYRSRYTYIFC